MKGADGFVQAYTAQAAVDAASQVIVAQFVNPAGGERSKTRPVAREPQRQPDPPGSSS